MPPSKTSWSHILQQICRWHRWCTQIRLRLFIANCTLKIIPLTLVFISALGEGSFHEFLCCKSAAVSCKSFDKWTRHLCCSFVLFSSITDPSVSDPCWVPRILNKELLGVSGRLDPFFFLVSGNQIYSLSSSGILLHKPLRLSCRNCHSQIIHELSGHGYLLFLEMSDDFWQSLSPKDAELLRPSWFPSDRNRRSWRGIEQGWFDLFMAKCLSCQQQRKE